MQNNLKNKPIIQTVNNYNSYLILKRIADVIISSIVIITTLPFFVLLVLLIQIESRGPAMYVQNRTGKDGKVFKLYKLRTMYIDSNDKGGGMVTIENDPRITKIGNLIRKASIDEFPQFINILKGDMSFIGPRPISTDEHDYVFNQLKEENKPIPQGLIHNVRPGITGWATLHGREKITYENRFKLNSEYENNLSLFFDLKIFYMTFKKYKIIFIAITILFLALLSILIKSII